MNKKCITTNALLVEKKLIKKKSVKYSVDQLFYRKFMEQVTTNNFLPTFSADIFLVSVENKQT